MKRRLGMAAAALVLLLAAAVVGIGFASQARIDRIHAVPATPVPVATDAATLAHGRHLAETRGCAECHGADYAGKVMVDDGFMGHIVSANLTGGAGGIAPQYGDAELARSIRHGVRRDGRSVVMMPAEDYFPMSDADVGALIAYLRTLPAVDRELGPTRLGPGARALLVLAGAPLLTAEALDPARPRLQAPAPAVNVEYGRYVAAVCVGCHARDYAGGLVNGPPGTPPSANLTPAGRLRGWTEAQFVDALRTGRTPDGRQLSAAAMPYPVFAGMDDTEARAIWAFLQTLPPVTR